MFHVKPALHALIDSLHYILFFDDGDEMTAVDRHSVDRTSQVLSRKRHY